MIRFLLAVVAVVLASTSFSIEARTRTVYLYNIDVDRHLYTAGQYRSIQWNFQPLAWGRSEGNFRERWLLEPAGNGWFVLRSGFAGRLLTVNRSTLWSNTTFVGTHPRFDGPHFRSEQLWKLQNGRVESATGECLVARWVNGIAVPAIGACNTTPAARWVYHYLT